MAVANQTNSQYQATVYVRDQQFSLPSDGLGYDVRTDPELNTLLAKTKACAFVIDYIASNTEGNVRITGSFPNNPGLPGLRSFTLDAAVGSAFRSSIGNQYPGRVIQAFVGSAPSAQGTIAALGLISEKK